MLANRMRMGGNKIIPIVAVASTQISTSPDGITWTRQTSPFDTPAYIGWIYSIAYGKDIWVIVGAKGTIATSSDSENWAVRTNHPFPNNDTILSVAYGGGKFVASCGEITATSPDGITWTQGGSTAKTLRRLHYNGSLWIGVSADGYITTSPDGITWTTRESGFGTSDIWGIAYGAGLWVAVGYDGKIATSPDGITWAQRANVFGTERIYGVIFAKNIFMAVGGTTGKVATSPDGITWTQISTPSYVGMIAYNKNLWLTNINGNTIATSPDGITWTTRESGFVSSGIQGIV